MIKSINQDSVTYENSSTYTRWLSTCKEVLDLPLRLYSKYLNYHLMILFIKSGNVANTKVGLKSEPKGISSRHKMKII